MKANELMIGDWISVMEIPAQVFELSYDKEEKEMTIGILDPQGEVYSCYYGYDHVEPIPLTAEILEKNGFNETFWGGEWTNNKVDFILIEHNDGFRVTNTNIVLSGVHQLQHALRLCNIEKEIEI